ELDLHQVFNTEVSYVLPGLPVAHNWRLLILRRSVTRNAAKNKGKRQDAKGFFITCVGGLFPCAPKLIANNTAHYVFLYLLDQTVASSTAIEKIEILWTKPFTCPFAE